jgi:hypothetical protein
MKQHKSKGTHAKLRALGAVACMQNLTVICRFVHITYAGRPLEGTSPEDERWNSSLHVLRRNRRGINRPVKCDVPALLNRVEKIFAFGYGALDKEDLNGSVKVVEVRVACGFSLHSPPFRASSSLSLRGGGRTSCEDDFVQGIRGLSQSVKRSPLFMLSHSLPVPSSFLFRHVEPEEVGKTPYSPPQSSPRL